MPLTARPWWHCPAIRHSTLELAMESCVYYLAFSYLVSSHLISSHRIASYLMSSHLRVGRADQLALLHDEVLLALRKGRKERARGGLRTQRRHERMRADGQWNTREQSERHAATRSQRKVERRSPAACRRRSPHHTYLHTAHTHLRLAVEEVGEDLLDARGVARLRVQRRAADVRVKV
jgi:hypothetical protein